MARDHLLPRSPDATAAGDLIEPPQPGSAMDGDVVLVEALRGLVLVDSVEEISATDAQGVVINSLEFPGADALAAALASYLGRPVTLSLLDEINQRIVAFGRARDRLVVDAFAPEGQDITAGTVHIMVVSGKRGTARIEGGTVGAPASFLDQSLIESGEVITESALRADLRWFNRNPFRRVNVILERGRAFGETDLVYEIDRARALRVYGAVEDSGTPISGQERWITGLNWGNAFGFDHQFNYQFTSSFDTDIVNAHSFSYTAPLRWRHEVLVFGSHVDSVPELDDPLFALDGKTWQVGFRYRVPLADYFGVQHELNAGYEFKRSNNDLEFGRLRVSTTTTVVSQFVVGHRATLIDRFGITTSDISLFLSPGDMYSDNRDFRFEAARAEASADYMYLMVNLERETRLPLSLSWLSRGEFQLSNENLLGSEQLGLGGYRSVRGYDRFDVAADMGLVLQNEIAARPFSLLGLLKQAGDRDSIRPFIFMDYGLGRSRHRLAGEPTRHLWSAGLGFRYRYANTLNVRCAYGLQLKDLPQSDVGSGRLHFSVMLSY